MPLINHSESVLWDEIILTDFQDKKSNITFSETRSITVDEEDYQIVLKHFSKRPDVKRVQFGYLTRLVLLYTRKKLLEKKGQILRKNQKSLLKELMG